MKKLLFKNQHGLTLLEVLLAFSLLTIIFTVFLTLFPQVGTFNQITGEKMIAINIAKQKLVIVQNNFGWQFIDNVKKNPQSKNTFSKDNPNYSMLALTEDIIEMDLSYRAITEKQELTIIIDIDKSPEISDVQELYKVAVIVRDRDNQILTELYGYINYRNGGS